MQYPKIIEYFNIQIKTSLPGILNPQMGGQASRQTASSSLDGQVQNASLHYNSYNSWIHKAIVALKYVMTFAIPYIRFPNNYGLHNSFHLSHPSLGTERTKIWLPLPVGGGTTLEERLLLLPMTNFLVGLTNSPPTRGLLAGRGPLSALLAALTRLPKP